MELHLNRCLPAATSRPGYETYAAKALAAVDGAELDPPIEGVAHVVGAEADDDLVRAHALAREARVQALVQPLQGLLDDRRAALRERQVAGGAAGAAGVAHHLHA